MELFTPYRGHNCPSKLSGNVEGAGARPLPLRSFVLGALLYLLGELLELLGKRRPEALDRRFVPIDAKLGRQLFFVEQVVVAGRLDRDCRLDRVRSSS